MKILFTLNSGFDTPGPSNHLLEAIIEKLLVDGCHVHIIEKHKTGINADIPESISKYHNLTYNVCKVSNVEKNNFVKRYISDIKYVFSSLRFLKKQKKVDVVFLQSCNIAFFFILFIKILIKKPVLFNVQDIFPKNASMVGLLKENTLVYKILKYLQYVAYNKADKIVTISEDMKQTLVNEKVPENKIDVIYNWSYKDEIINIPDEDNKFIKKYKINGSKYKVVYAGNIGKVQNIEVIMAAANLLKDEKNIYFYIIGDGVSKDKHTKFAKDNGLKNVIFYPMQPSEYASHLYSMADINIIPLAKGIIKTALPSKTATILSCGKPIIACVDSDSNFARMIEECDKCTIIDSDDSVGLAKCIKEYFSENISGFSSDERELFKKNFLKRNSVVSYVNSIKQLRNFS